MHVSALRDPLYLNFIDHNSDKNTCIVHHPCATLEHSLDLGICVTRLPISVFGPKLSEPRSADAG